MPAAAIMLSMHTCPQVTVVVPHVGGPVMAIPVNVNIGVFPAATMQNPAICVGPPDQISKGSSSVMIGGKAAARMGDLTAHGGSIVMGEPTVNIGG